LTFSPKPAFSNSATAPWMLSRYALMRDNASAPTQNSL
jgi:hypothetical protein